MSQWIKKPPIAPIYLAFILVWAYFAVYCGSSSFILGYVLLLRLFFSYPSRKSVALAFLSLFVFFSSCLSGNSRAESLGRTSFSYLVQGLADTIKVNGDSLSFRGQRTSALSSLSTRSNQPAKESFQQLTDLVVLDMEAEFEHAQQHRNFSGFDYQAYVRDFTVPKNQ